MIFSVDEIAQLLDVVNNYHVFFLYNNVGGDFLTEKEKEVLISFGIDLNRLEGQVDYVDYAFRFGLLAEALGDTRSAHMNFIEFKRFLSSGNYIPLSEVERNALAVVKRQSYQDIKGLGNRIAHDLETVIVEGDRRQRSSYQKIIQQEATEAVKNRESVKQLVSRFGHKTEDWTRDFGRIADYIMHSAYDEGRAMSILKAYGDDQLVYKLVFPDACDKCAELFTTDGIGSEPKLFKLSALMANGSNIGRKKEDWKPVVGPVHPFCRCPLYRKPTSSTWDKESQSYKLDTSKLKKTGKIGIKIDDGPMRYR